MLSTPSLVTLSTRAGALVAILASVSACAPTSATTQQAAAAAPQSPILLSCPAGQQPLLRQVVVNGATVPQVECVAAPTPLNAYAQPALAAASPVAAAPVYQPGYAAAPAYAPPVYSAPAGYVPVSTSSRPAARRSARHAIYEDDVVEYREKKGRSWQKSALIIGSSAGIGAGVGAATGGKKGALIGAAIGGGAATVWDQVSRR